MPELHFNKDFFFKAGKLDLDSAYSVLGQLSVAAPALNIPREMGEGGGF